APMPVLAIETELLEGTPGACAGDLLEPERADPLPIGSTPAAGDGDAIAGGGDLSVALGIDGARKVTPVRAIGAERELLVRGCCDARRSGHREESSDQCLGELGAPAIAALTTRFGDEEADTRLGREDHVGMEIAGV